MSVYRQTGKGSPKMGMSASQARLLSITARLSHNELESQLITNSKTRLANKTQEANKEYLRALNQEKLVYRTFDAKGNQTSVPLTAAAMYTYSDIKNQYGISNASGQLLVSSLDARNYENSATLVDFLKCYNVQDIGDLEAQQLIIDNNNVTIHEITKNLRQGTAQIPSYNQILSANNSDALSLGYIEKSLSMLVWGDKTSDTIEANGITVQATFDDANTSDKSLITFSNHITNVWPEFIRRISNNFIVIGEWANIHTAFDRARNVGLTAGDFCDTDGNDFTTTTESDGSSYLKINKDLFESNGWTLVRTAPGNTSMYNQEPFTPYLINESGDKIKLIEEANAAGDGYDYYYAQFVDGAYNIDGTFSLSHYEKQDLNNFSPLTNTMTYGDLNGGTNTYTAPGTMIKVGNKYFNYEGKQVWLRTSSTTKEKGNITYENSSNFSNLYDFIQANKDEYNCVDQLNTMINELYCNVLAYMQANNDNPGFDTTNTYTYYSGNTETYDTYRMTPVSSLTISGNTVMSIAEMKERIQEIYEAYDNLAARMTFEYKQQIGEFSGEREWYTNLWYRMNGGSETKITDGRQYYKELDDNLMNSDTWMQFALEHGTISLEQVKFTEEAVTGATNTGIGMPNREWATLIYSNASEIVREEDEVAIARAEAKYKSLLNEIESKDKNYDNKLKRLDNEHDAIKTEYDSIKEVLNKNIDRSFKTFS